MKGTWEEVVLLKDNDKTISRTKFVQEDGKFWIVVQINRKNKKDHSYRLEDFQFNGLNQVYEKTWEKEQGLSLEEHTVLSDALGMIERWNKCE